MKNKILLFTLLIFPLYCFGQNLLIEQNVSTGIYQSNRGVGQIFILNENSKLDSITVFSDDGNSINSHFKIIKGPDAEIIYQKTIVINPDPIETTVSFEQEIVLDKDTLYAFIFCLTGDCNITGQGDFITLKAGCFSPTGEYYLGGYAINSIEPEEFDPNISFSHCDLVFQVYGGPPTTVPVELINFQASKKHPNAIQLKWETASESNSKGFEVEKSISGKNWTSLALIPGTGNSQETTSYQYLDKNSFKGVNYYRLKQIDLDDQIAYSKIISIDMDVSSKISIFPNPTSGIVNIKGSDENKIVVYDSLGRILISKKDISKINISELPNGIYFISIEGEIEELVERIIKY